MNSNSHPAPCSHNGQEQLQTSRREPIEIKLCRKHLSQIMEISSFLFGFQTLDLISQSLQPSQDPAKDPKRNSWARHLHNSSPTTLKFWCFLPSWWSFPPHKSHLRRGGRTWCPECNWNCTGLDILEKKLHNRPHCIPKCSANIPRITIPVASCS